MKAVESPRKSKLTHKAKIIAFYALAVVFIIIDCFLIAKYQTYAFNLLPVAIIVIAAMFFALDKVLLFSVLCIPFSIPLKEFYPDLGFNIDIPTEPLFVGIMLIFILKQLIEHKYDRKILKHPLSVVVIIYIIWHLVTVCTSTMPLVSIKSWLASLWFILPFFFLGILLFKDEKNIYRFFFLYMIPFAALIILTLVKHSAYNFDQHIGNGIMNPFFNDHTSYGAAIAMFTPFLLGFSLSRSVNWKWRIVTVVLLGIFVTGLIFSYTRAAWISLLGALAMFLILKLRISNKIVFALIVIGIGGFVLFQDKIIIKMEGNRVESSTDFSKHIKSISNITSDASNLERINRWHCAIRMFKEKPVFGWGPGTYQFKYAPFQHSDEKTIISTNAGDGGNAHSDYLGSLAESGLFGMLNYILVCIMIYITGTRTYHRVKDKRQKLIVASALCGLVTYFIHGALNNFLDIDKIAVPFWCFAAMIVAIDLFCVNKEDEVPAEKIVSNKPEV
ncbi:MAG: O-antigen ligase family protein [Bacteroidales bacterium]|nr:O-antigen ligase family protein [Bacteroidales bacterium]